MYCIECGSVVSDNTNFCNHCGTKNDSASFGEMKVEEISSEQNKLESNVSDKSMRATNNTYKVVLNGVQQNVSRDATSSKLAELFRVKPDQINALLENAGYVLKNNVTLAVACQYKDAIEEAGAICQVIQEIPLGEKLELDLPVRARWSMSESAQTDFSSLDESNQQTSLFKSLPGNEVAPSLSTEIINEIDLKKPCSNVRNKESLVDNQSKIKKPESVSTAVNLLWAALVVGVVKALMDVSNIRNISGMVPAELIIIIVVFSLALFFFLLLKISAGKNWARITFLIMFIGGVLPTVPIVSAEFSRSAVVGALSMVQIGIQIYVALLLFTRPGSNWFRKSEAASVLTLRNERATLAGPTPSAVNVSLILWISIFFVTVFGAALILYPNYTNESEKEVLESVSGVWRGDTDGVLVSISLAGDKKIIYIDNSPIRVAVKSIDRVNNITTLTVNLSNGELVTWTIRKIFSENGSFTLQITLHDGAQDSLSFVRNL